MLFDVTLTLLIVFLVLRHEHGMRRRRPLDRMLRRNLERVERRLTADAIAAVDPLLFPDQHVREQASQFGVTAAGDSARPRPRTVCMHIARRSPDHLVMVDGQDITRHVRGIRLEATAGEAPRAWIETTTAEVLVDEAELVELGTDALESASAIDAMARAHNVARPVDRERPDEVARAAASAPEQEFKRGAECDNCGERIEVTGTDADTMAKVQAFVAAHTNCGAAGDTPDPILDPPLEKDDEPTPELCGATATHVGPCILRDDDPHAPHVDQAGRKWLDPTVSAIHGRHPDGTAVCGADPACNNSPKPGADACPSHQVEIPVELEGADEKAAAFREAAQAEYRRGLERIPGARNVDPEPDTVMVPVVKPGSVRALVDQRDGTTGLGDCRPAEGGVDAAVATLRGPSNGTPPYPPLPDGMVDVREWARRNDSPPSSARKACTEGRFPGAQKHPAPGRHGWKWIVPADGAPAS